MTDSKSVVRKDVPVRIRAWVKICIVPEVKKEFIHNQTKFQKFDVLNVIDI